MQLIEINHKYFIGQTQQSKPDIGGLDTAALTTDPCITPRALPCRSVPLALKTKVKMELDSSCEKGIMERVSKPIAWVN